MEWDYKYTVLTVAMFAQVSQQASRLAISPVVPQIMDWFDVTEGTIGLVLTGMWAAYALCQFPSGVLGDRFGERRVVLLSMSLMGFSSLLLALSPSFFLLGVFVVLLGGGTGLYYSVAASLLTKLFDETGQALGIHSAAGAAAGLFVPVVAAVIGVRFGWQVAVLIGLAMAIPSIVFFLWYVQPTGNPDKDAQAVNPVNDGQMIHPADDTQTPTSVDEARVSNLEGTQTANPDVSTQMNPDLPTLSVLARGLVRPRVVYMTLLASVGIFSWQAMQSFYPTFLVDHHSFSPQAAGGAFGLIFLFSTVSQPVTGKLSDTVGRDTVIAITFTVTALAYAGVLIFSRPVLILVLTALLGAGMSWFPVMQARIMDGFSDTERGSQFGLVRTLYMFIGASGSVVTGTLVDAAGWTSAYGLLIVLLGVGVVSLVGNRLFRLGV